MIIFHVRIGAQHRLGQTLGLIAQGIDIATHLIVADHHTHAATHVGILLAKDANA